MVKIYMNTFCEDKEPAFLHKGCKKSINLVCNLCQRKTVILLTGHITSNQTTILFKRLSIDFK